MTLTDQKTQNDHLGGKLLKTFYHLISSVRIHKDNNQLVKDGVTNFNAIVSELSGDGELAIQIWRGRFHLQGEKLVYQRETFHIINEMLEFFSRRELGGLCFLPLMKTASPENLVLFIRLLDESAKHDDPPGWLDLQLEKNRFSWMEIFRKPDESQQNTGQNAELDIDEQKQEHARRAYFLALDTVKEMTEKASKDNAGVRKARRLAQTIVDMASEDGSLTLRLASMKDYEDHTYMHSVNVALLATCLGRHVGLSPISLEYLAISALFHDLGKMEAADEIPLKQDELSKEELGIVQRHPLISVKKILGLDIPHSLRSRIILGPFEHHLNPDLSGYPKTRFVKEPSLFGKILRIADVYDALTSEHFDNSTTLTPDEALRRMWSEKGRSFDTILLKNFINLMGIHPIGSIVELDSGEVGIVMDYPDESEKSLPLIMLVIDDGKGGKTRGELVNLAAQGIDGEKPRRNIVKSLHFSQLGIDPSQFFQHEVGTFLNISSHGVS
jgi:HD-GYP domain-containing protein (c-di-GMP phosphodiesterase class II)